MSQDKEWHDFPQLPNLTILPWIVWGVLIGLVLAGTFYASRLYAEPRFTAQGEGVVITLYDEPCDLEDQITNLPYKATWVENGKTFKGCFVPRPDAGFVIAYFDDKTVALIPFKVLQKVGNA